MDRHPLSLTNKVLELVSKLVVHSSITQYIICRCSSAQSVVKAARYSTTYHATNEPIYGYEKGSSERLELDEKLAMYASKVHDVPIVIGNEEIQSGTTMHQVMVRVVYSLRFDVI